jgi:hypothetical protein
VWYSFNIPQLPFNKAYQNTQQYVQPTFWWRRALQSIWISSKGYQSHGDQLNSIASECQNRIWNQWMNVIPLGWINHGLNDFVEWMFLLHESVSVNESDSIGLDTL